MLLPSSGTFHLFLFGLYVVLVACFVGWYSPHINISVSKYYLEGFLQNFWEADKYQTQTAAPQPPFYYFHSGTFYGMQSLECLYYLPAVKTMNHYYLSLVISSRVVPRA